jgi:hypothetical protein
LKICCYWPNVLVRTTRKGVLAEQSDNETG